jgi:hypothetical protein
VRPDHPLAKLRIDLRLRQRRHDPARRDGVETRMPSSAQAIARLLVSCATPPLLAAIAGRGAAAEKLIIEAMVTITPWLRASFS